MDFKMRYNYNDGSLRSRRGHLGRLKLRVLRLGCPECSRAAPATISTPPPLLGATPRAPTVHNGAGCWGPLELLPRDVEARWHSSRNSAETRKYIFTAKYSTKPPARVGSSLLLGSLTIPKGRPAASQDTSLEPNTNTSPQNGGDIVLKALARFASLHTMQ